GRIRDGTYENVHSLLVVKDGKLVFEEYFPGYTWNYADEQFRGAPVDFDRDTRHNLASVTKSFTSALVGIAIDRGLIGGVEDRVFAYFPDYAHLQAGGKARLTLEHLLTMQSGLAWNEMDVFYDTTENDLIHLFTIPDPVDYILSRRLVAEPGTTWYYNGGNTNLLGEAIRQASGQRMDAFAEQHLFGPLGITNYEWDFINPDFIHASGNLQLRPRDMAKFGQLYLDGGVWGGQQVVSRAWVEVSTRSHAIPRWADGYGYQWWLRAYDSGGQQVDAFYADGWGGQRILVLPELEMVVVFTGGNYVQDTPMDEILTRFILPAALARQQRLRWGLALAAIAILLGLLGFGAYRLACRLAARPPVATPWPRALGLTAWSVAGNTIGLLLLLAFYTLFLPGGSTGSLVLLVPFLVGWLVFRAPRLAARLGIGYGRALRRALLTELISAGLVLAGMFPVLYLGVNDWLDGRIDLVSPPWWGLLALAAALGALVAYPFHLWLARRGLEAAPSLRTAWAGLLLSLVLLVASLGLTMGFVA
ncbi:MAG: serine hydrolase, partial [Anaerolineae bacterium]